MPACEICSRTSDRDREIENLREDREAICTRRRGGGRRAAGVAAGGAAARGRRLAVFLPIGDMQWRKAPAEAR